MKNHEANVIWKFLLESQRTIIVVTGIVTIVTVFLACMFRYFLNQDLKAYDEWLLMSAFWLYMIGGAHASSEKSHITADILNVYLKEGRKKSVINLIKLTATFILGIVFMLWALEYVMWTVNLGSKTPVYQIPAVIGVFSVFCGFLLMSFYNLVYLMDEIKGCVSKHSRRLKGGQL